MGRLRFSGWQAWPDHVDEHAGVVLVIGLPRWMPGYQLVFGFGGRCDVMAGNPWLQLYLGLWAVEIYWDGDQSWEL